MVVHIALDFKSFFFVKIQPVKYKETKTRILNDFQRVLKMPKKNRAYTVPLGYMSFENKGAEIENEDRFSF